MDQDLDVALGRRLIPMSANTAYLYVKLLVTDCDAVSLKWFGEKVV